ncbi:hypothetical protein [Sphingobium sp. HDIP04]|uniref:hypothetical protein n=1 Tax=Sphingobium sp. HDIP04 TaxID=428994 RepID=UPI00038786E5|nr:hypothetical protein [Sphingobium sp. HDIP04]EQA97274.1 hypothetical protein L286_23400 [Sphingobium sp. HDIP04]
MTDQSAIFPAFIRAEYDPSGQGFSLFEREAGESAARARRAFEANFAEVERVINGAVSRGLKTSGAIDLGVAEFRQAAAQAKAYELSLRTTRDAAQALAISTGDTSAQTRSYLQALSAQVVEATRAREAADAQVTTYTRLQAEIDATAARNTALAASYRELYAEQARAARDEVYARRSQESYNGALGVSRPSAMAGGAGFSALDQQVRDMERLGIAATQLHAQLDPMYAAQQRFNQALDTADDLLKANIIDERLHAAAVQNARDQLQAHSNAIHAQNDGFHQLARGSGILRQAYIQTGQQGQDLVISLIGGQRASVVFAQQLPQLAFALSGLGVQADGTQKGIGRIATLLSGPWGIAFTGAAFAVGLLVEKLWQHDEASKATKKAIEEEKRAIEALNEAAERSIQTTEDRARAAFIDIDIRRQNAQATRDETKAMLEQAKIAAEKKRDDVKITARGDVINPGFVAATREVERLTQLLKDNQDQLDRLSRNTNINRGNYIASITDQMRTAEGRANRRFDIERNSVIAKGGSDEAVANALARIETARAAELAKIRETEQALKSSGTARDREAATVGQVSKLLLSAFGGTITSTTGSQHVRGSYHYKGQAVDFVPAGGMGSITKAQIRAAAEAAGLTVKELLGPGDKGHSDHFHLAWAGGKNEVNSDRINDQLARAAERQAEEAKRQAEELQRAAETLFSKFDQGRAAAVEYADALAEIDRVMKAGLISPDDALAYGIAAAQQKVANDNERNQRAMDQMDKDLWGDRKKEGELFNEQQEDSLRRQRELAREANRQIDTGLQHIADFFGNDVARFLARVSERAPADSGLSLLLKGVGAGTDLFNDSLSKAISSGIEEIFGKENVEKIGKTLGEAMGAAGVGASAGNLAFGGANSALGSSIGGALGNKIGEKFLTKGLEKIAKGLGDFAGPLGSIAGGLLGGALGGLLSKPKWGTAVVTGQGSGDVTVAGNKAAYRSNANLAGTSIQSGLDAIAEQLGADIGDYSVSIGQYKGKWRVSTTGRSGKLKAKYGDVTDFGKEGGEDAIKFAISDAVKDGALLGLRASTQALLTRSSDIEGQLQKALDFEGVFHRLKEYTDPVGAAMDTLDKEFNRLKKIFEEAGASTEEYASLEELYGKERAAAVKDAAEKVTASLKSLFDELTVGNDARSLRERLAEAQAKYNPLAQRVAGGDISAYDDYSDAARTLLDLQRQVYGSSEDYFKLLDQVTALTKTRIDAESNVASISAARDSIFASESAAAPVVSATESQTQQLVAALNGQTGSLATILQAILNNQLAAMRGSGAGTPVASNLLSARGNF